METTTQTQGSVIENIKPQLSTWRLLSLCVSLLVGLFLSLLDASIVATALFSIGVDLDALDQVTWVAEAYMLTYVGFAVLFAGFADVYGRFVTQLAATVIFLAFSIGCGFCTSIPLLIACRALQGIGGSGLYSLAMITLPEISPPKLLKWLGSLAGMTVAVAGLCGPVLGGLLTQLSTWRWVFWLNGPFCFLSLILFSVSWPRTINTCPVERRRFRQLDIGGCTLLSVACVLTVFAFQEGGRSIDGWVKPIFLAPIIMGVVCWITLLAWEVTIAKHPLWNIYAIFPARITRNRVLVFAGVSTVCAGFTYFAVIYNLPLRYQVVNGRNPLMTGVSILPTLGSAAVGSMVGGLLASKPGMIFPTFFAGCCLMMIGTISLATLSNTYEVQNKSYGLQLFTGLGFGLNISTATMLITYMCETKDRALGQGIITQLRIFGGSVGLGAASAILARSQRRHLAGIMPLSALSQLNYNFDSLDDNQQHAVRQAYSDAFSETMKVCAIVCGAATILSFGVYRKQDGRLLRREKQNPST